MYGKILVGALDRLYAQVGHPLTIIETGTMYYDTLEPGETSLVQRSTFAIAQWIKGSGVPHVYHSVDFSEGHIATCKRVLAENGFDGIVQHHYGDAARVLEGFDFPIDFAILDTAIEPEVTLDEYHAVKGNIRRPGIVIIDDTFVQVGASAVNKGRTALPYSEREGFRNWTRVKQFGTQRGETLAAIAYGPESEAILSSIPGWFESTGKPQR